MSEEQKRNIEALRQWGDASSRCAKLRDDERNRDLLIFMGSGELAGCPIPPPDPRCPCYSYRTRGER